MKNNKIYVIFIILNMNPDLALSTAASKARESKKILEQAQRDADAAMADLAGGQSSGGRSSG
jgi:hypothetical protein